MFAGGGGSEVADERGAVCSGIEHGGRQRGWEAALGVFEGKQ